MSDLRKQKKDNKENKQKKKLKVENIIYIVLGVLIVATLIAVPIIVGTTSSAGAGTVVPPCCE